MRSRGEFEGRFITSEVVPLAAVRVGGRMEV